MGKITTCMEAAEKTLKEVKKLVKATKIELYLQPYQNGREHGYALLNLEPHPSKQVCFAEYRNTDNIVVYFGTTMDFAMAGNVPSDAVYSDKEFFSYDDPATAAKFIIACLQ